MLRTLLGKRFSFVSKLNILRILKFIFILLFSLLLNGCVNPPEPILEKISTLTYLGEGEFIIETTIITPPNIPVRIMTDGITAPNNITITNVKKNGVSLDSESFESDYLRTNQGNFRFVRLKYFNYSASTDSIYIKYQTNVLSANQKKRFKGKEYSLEVKLREIIPQSQPPIKVKTSLIIKSANNSYVPIIYLRPDFDVEGVEGTTDIRYFRTYQCTDFNTFLTLPYEPVEYKPHNPPLIGEIDRSITIKNMDLVEETIEIEYKNPDSLSNITFNMPFRKGLTNPDIVITTSANTIIPFPIDSISFLSKSQIQLLPNEAYYYIGGFLDEDIIQPSRNFLYIKFALDKGNVARLKINSTYKTKYILTQLDYFNFEIKLKPLYTYDINKYNKLTISLPNDYSFEENKTEIRMDLDVSKNKIILRNINRPELLMHPIVFTFSKDGSSFYTIIKIINVCLTIIFVIILLVFYPFKFDYKYIYKIAIFIILVLPNIGTKDAYRSSCLR